MQFIHLDSRQSTLKPPPTLFVWPWINLSLSVSHFVNKLLLTSAHEITHDSWGEHHLTKKVHRPVLIRPLGPFTGRKRDPERGLDPDAKPHPGRTLGIGWRFQAKLLSPLPVYLIGLLFGENEEKNGKLSNFLTKIQLFVHFCPFHQKCPLCAQSLLGTKN